MGIGLAIAQQAGAAATAATTAAPRPAVPPYLAGPMEPPPIPQPTLFHIVVDGERRGPFDAAALAEQAALGARGRATLVWRPGMAEWAPAAAVPEVAALL